MNKDCVSLEIAQKLQKAGWKGITAHVWWKHAGDVEYTLITNKQAIEYSMLRWVQEFIPAPTATQLAEELPAYIEVKGKDGHLGFWKRSLNSPNMKYGCNYQNLQERPLCYTNAPTLPDALGLMMEYLLVDKLI